MDAATYLGHLENSLNLEAQQLQELSEGKHPELHGKILADLLRTREFLMGFKDAQQETIVQFNDTISALVASARLFLQLMEWKRAVKETNEN